MSFAGPIRFERVYLAKYGREDERVMLFFEDLYGPARLSTFEECVSLLNDRKLLIQGEQQGA